MSDIVSLKAHFKKCVPNIVSVTLEHNNGGTLVKKICLKDFFQIFNSAISEETIKTDFSALRWNGIPDGLVDIAYQDNKNFMILLQVPAEIFIVEYCGNKYSIPFPSLLFSIKVINGKATETNVFAVKDVKASKNTVLYHFPFGNVYDNGKICWGGNSLPAINSPLESTIIPRLFYSAPTNSDLWNAEKRLDVSIVKCEPVLSKIYEALHNKKTFPLDALMVSSMTIDKLYNI